MLILPLEIESLLMKGRNKFVLTQQDIIDLDKHIRALPFKRRMQKAFLEMVSERESMNELNETDLKLIQRCRYERNAYNLRVIQLELIKKTEPNKLKKLELDILELSKRTDIDAYFSMHDALKEILKIKRNKTAEKNLTTQIDRVLNPEKYNKEPKNQSLRKQQNHIKYFFGSLYLKLLEQSNLKQSDPNKNLDLMLDLFKLGISEKIGLTASSVAQMEQLINEAKLSPQNPFKKN